MLPGFDIKGPTGRSITGALDLTRVAVFVFVAVLTALIYSPAPVSLDVDVTFAEPAAETFLSPIEMDVEGVLVAKGEPIITRGEPVDELSITKLELIEADLSGRAAISSMLGVFVLTFVLLTLSYIFAVGNIKRIRLGRKDLLLVAVVLACEILFIGFSKVAAKAMMQSLEFFPPHFYTVIVPVAIGPMLIMLFLGAESAFVFAAITSVIAGTLFGGMMEIIPYFFIGSIAAAIGVRYSTQRSTVIKAGLVLGVVNAFLLIGISAIKGAPGYEYSLMAFAGLVNGIVTAVIAVGLGPVFESLFRYTTNIRLLELSRTDHPLLKKLAGEAPGTFQHSITMGTLVEAAAEAIDANPLLARVSAYYHDIGKAAKPQYFIENMKGENRHDKLQPSMSALIIINHVKEGVEMATTHRLGKEITDVIKEHHGTSLIKYFFDRAKRQAEEMQASVDERDFRYPGPKPQTKEAGLVMLADAIEAASKTIPDPTPDKIQGMTQKIVNRYFADGQLDECELTLKDLHLITSSFNKVFSGIFHQRIDYPEPAYMTKEDSGAEGSDRGEDEVGPEDKTKGDGRENLKRLGLH